MMDIKQLLHTQKKRQYWLLFFSLLLGIVIVLQAYLIVQVIYEVFLNGASFQSILYLLGILFVVILARMTINHLIGFTSLKLGSQAKKQTRTHLLHHFSKKSITPTNNDQSGKQIGLLLDTIDEIDPYFSEYIPKMIQASIIPILLLIVIFTQNYQTGLIILFTAPFIPLFMAIIGKKTKDRSDEQLDQMNAFSAQFLDTIQGLKTLKLFGVANKEEDKIEKSTLGFRDATMKVLTVAFTSAFMMELISMLSMGLIALEVSFRMIVFDSITFQTAFFMLILAPEFYVFLKDLSGAFHTGRESMTAYKKVNEEISTELKKVSWGDQSLEQSPPSIEVSNVFFQYEQNGFQLGPITLQIEPYEKIALVGESGSGKTSLFYLLAGLMEPDSGSMHLNDQPRNTIESSSFFNQLGYLSQDPYIFSGTIKENVSLGCKTEPSDQEVWDALHEVALAPLISKLEDGIYTMIGEAGRGLSGGEKQRLALSRILLKQPSFLLFDEPTAGLDLKTEKLIQQTIENIASKMTIITIAHRKQTIQTSNRIWLLKDGELVADGSHEELKQTSDAYRQLFLEPGKESG